MEGMNPNNNNDNNSCTTRQVLEKKARPQEQLNCPRCNSTNTKFCYYNNYSLTQPRYFCKTCRRYWTEGGSLRNVPVGGGSRKNKKINNSSSSISISSSPAPAPPASAPASTSSKIIVHHDLINPNAKMLQGGGQDLNLAFSMDKYHHHGLSIPFIDNSSSSSPSSLSALELLRSSMASRGLSHPLAPNNPLIPNSSSALYPSLGFPMQEVNKANNNNNNSLGFSMDHDGMGNNRSNYDDHVQENNNINNGGGRVLFPFGEVKHQHLSSSGGSDHGVENNKEQGNSSTGYWSGMIGEGSW